MLVAFSTELKQAVRAEDIACRYGGDEFVLILLDASLEVAQARAEEVRVATEALQITYQKQSLGKVTVSAGVAMFPVNGVNPEVLLHAADTALYRAETFWPQLHSHNRREGLADLTVITLRMV